jgi:AcrR family transcriptional regulator
MAEAEKRAEILKAAQALALRHGLNGVTMEAVAKQARVAKPTLYKYYRDKNAVFEAIVTELLVTLHRRFADALAGEGSVAERIAAGLVAKYAAITAFMAGSPHADELYNEHDRLAAPQVEAAERAAQDAVVAALQAGGVADAKAVAEVVVSGAYGIFRRAKPGEDIAPAIGLLVQRVVGS